MARTLTKSIILTKVKNYHWQVLLIFDVDKAPHAQVVEDYDVIDDAGSVSPEGHSQKIVEFSADEQAALDALVLRALKRAAIREQVDVEPSIKPTTDTVDETVDVIAVGTMAVKPVGKIIVG